MCDFCNLADTNTDQVSYTSDVHKYGDSSQKNSHLS